MGTHGTGFRWVSAMAGVVLTLALGGACIPAAIALAAQGTLVITQRHNTDATYDAYRVFAADVGPGDVVSHVAWPSDAMRTAVLSFLDERGYPEWLEQEHPSNDQHDLAQNAAEYVSVMIGDANTTTDGTTVPRTPEGRSFATGLASSIVQSGVAVDATVTNGEQLTAEQGLWLIVTSPASLADPDDVGTAPLWVALGGSVSEIEEKNSLPTVDKEVCEDSTGSWGHNADANRGQALEYRLVGTLPADFDSYARYHYRFEDSFSTGISLDVPVGGSVADALTVHIGQTEATVDGEHLAASFENGMLTVDFADLMEAHWDACDIEPDTTITVTYRAHLNGSAAIGSKGNPNQVHLVHTNNPVTLEDGRSPDVQAKVYSYELHLRKEDEQSGSALKDAAFVVLKPKESPSDAEEYLRADGSWSKESHRFVTAGNGSIEVSGIDEGSYLIREVKAPDGYQALDEDIRLVITSKIVDGDVPTVTLNAKSSEKQSKISSVDANAGVVELTVSDKRRTGHDTPIGKLAQTGQGPLALFLVAMGTALIVLSAVKRLKSRDDGVTRR